MKSPKPKIKKFEILPAAEVRFFGGKKKAEGVDENN